MKTLKPNTQLIFNKLTTIENALEWQDEQDKFLYCFALLTGEDLRGNDTQVEILESMFEKLLEETGQ